MALKIYKIGEFDHLAENKQFEKICSLLKEAHQTSDGPCVFIANYNIGGVELDGLLLQKDSIILVEFKNIGGHIVARENGNWLAGRNSIKGGANNKNPFVQMRLNRSRAGAGLSHFLKKEPLVIHGLLVFNRPSTFDTSALSPAVRNWLFVCDNRLFIQTLHQIHAQRQLFTDEEFMRIEEELNLSDYLYFSSDKSKEILAESPYSISSAILYYDDLLDNHKDEEKDIQAKYNELSRILQDVLNEKTKHSRLHFSGPFARLDYVCKEYGITQEKYNHINSLRARCRNINQKDAHLLQAEYLYDLKALVDFISVVYIEPPFKEFENILPKHMPVHEQSTAMLQESMRIAVESWDDTYIYGKVANEESASVKICYTKENYFGDWSYIADMLTENRQLNVIRPRVENQIYYPELFIVEPDYLIDISSIAACFEQYGTTPYTYLINKIKPPINKKAILLGNLAGQLLDDAIYDPDTSYMESVQSFFRKNALPLATCEDMDVSFHEDAKSQRNHIHQAIESFVRDIKGFTPNDLLVEPSFICEMLGIQGRMDLLQTNKRFLLEQKSGKRAFQSTGHLEKHYVQILLYQAILRYNYNLKNEEITSILFYSKFPDGAIKEGPAPKLLFSALKLRNEIAVAELNYGSGEMGYVLSSLTPEKLNVKNVSGTLWERYTMPELHKLLVPINQADPVNFQYFSRLLTFIQKEHILSKTGSPMKEASGFAALWNASLSEKKLAGNIYDDLLLLKKENTAEKGGFDLLTFKISDKESDFLPNFRQGDIVIVYPYKAVEPDVRKQIVYRGSIKEVKADAITILLRSPQRNEAVFAQQANERWAIEHDFMESSSNSSFKGVYSFLTANQERRDLLLNRRIPLCDKRKTLVGDYETFNEMVLKAKQAVDFFLLVGPPGTGKTSFGLIHILQESLLDANSSVLITAYTNRAVDEICGKLREKNIPFLRIGSELSCASAYKDDLLCNRSKACKNVHEIANLIKDTRVLLGTTTSLSGNTNLFSLKKFTLALVDEASQILEPHLLPLLCAKHGQVNAIDKFVFIGDHKQLPAVVQQSKLDSKVHEPSLIAMGLTDCRDSLFERLLRQYKDYRDIHYMLCKQGRMHPDISLFPNYAFYQMKLQSVPVKHQQKELAYSNYDQANGIEALLASRRLVFLASHNDIASQSVKVNLSEAKIIAATLHSLWRLYAKNGKNFDAETVGIIVPYRNQISVIRNEISKYGIEKLMDVTIDTVERYQGSQREVIIYGFTIRYDYQLDFLTGNNMLEEGFVIDRKLNVVLTRAREQLILVGNPLLLNADFTFYKLIEFIRSKQGYFDLLTDTYCQGNFTVSALEKQPIFTDNCYNLTPTFSHAFHQSVLTPIKEDARTEWPFAILGNDMDKNREIIGYGRGNFSNQLELFESKEVYSATDKVLLYCFYNMRMHYCSAKAVYEAMHNFIQAAIQGHSERVLFCDTGCGPGTGGLAFADLFPLTKRWKYIGVDTSIPMMRKAEEFFQSQSYENVSCRFTENFMAITDEDWQEISTNPTLVLFNYSFFFANIDVLTAEKLAERINEIAGYYPLNTYIIINQNSPNDQRNKSYKVFKKRLSERFNTSGREGTVTVKYKTNTEEKESRIYYDVISNRL